MSAAEPALARRAPTAAITPTLERLAEPALVVALVVGAALIRWVDLWSVPIFTDEGDESDLALRIFHEGARPLTNDDPYLGPLFNYLLAGVFWLVGPSPWLPRLVVLVLGALTVGAAYLLARELTLAADGSDRQAMLGGAIAALLLVVNPSHVVVSSHVAWGNCATPFFTTIGCWLLVRALRLREDDGAARPAAGIALLLAGAAFGLAFETHPLAAAFFPPIVLFVLWRARAWLLTPWPYVAAGVFVAAQLPTLLFVAHDGGARWIASIHEKQTMYDGDQALDTGSVVDRLGGLIHAFGAALGGLINDRDTPVGATWHPAVLLALALTLVALVWLWRRRQPLVPLLVVSNLALLPLVNGKYVPIISESRYLVPTIIVALAAIGAWAAALLTGATGAWSLRGRGDWQAGRRLAPVLLALALGIYAAASLATFYADAQRDARTNDQLLASLAALDAAYQPGDVIVVDRAMYRDWTLTEGRLQRVFVSWLALRGVPSRVLDLDDNGRLRMDLATQGGLAVLAQQTVASVARGYQVEEIASGAAPGAPAGSGYSVVRIRSRQ